MPCYVERDRPVGKESYGSNGMPVRFSNRLLEGLFKNWSEAVDYVEDNNLCGATIWEFED